MALAVLARGLSIVSIQPSVRLALTWPTPRRGARVRVKASLAMPGTPASSSLAAATTSSPTPTLLLATNPDSVADVALRHLLEGLGLHVRTTAPAHARLSHEAAAGTRLLVLAPSCEEALGGGDRAAGRMPPLPLPALVLGGGAWSSLHMASSVSTAVSAWVRLAAQHGLSTDLGPAGRVPLYLAPHDMNAITANCVAAWLM